MLALPLLPPAPNIFEIRKLLEVGQMAVRIP
jgi:hypothetical protein